MASLAPIRTLTDGPSVVRTIASRAALEADPKVAGLLDAPLDGTLPASLTVRTDADGVRIASLNIHMATPARLGLDDVANEDIHALRDMARLINAAQPDVLLVQELRNRPVEAAIERGGLGDTASLLAHLTRADDMAFTPAIAQDPFTTPHARYGTAIYTYNGFRIDQAVNVRLPTSTPDVELRSVGIAAIRSPDARPDFTVAGSHLANRPELDADLRSDQLRAIVELADGIRTTGGFAYRDAITGEQLVARGFPRGRFAFGGDVNQLQQPTDSVLRPAGIVHVNDTLRASGRPGAHARADAAEVDTSIIGQHRIDMLYARGWRVDDSGVGAVLPHEYAGEATDHLLLTADLR